MHSGNGLHDAAVAHAQTPAVYRLHPTHVRCPELRERNAFVVVDGARHAGRPQQLIVQVSINELVDVAQILQQFPGFAERRSDQLDQRFGKVGRNVLVREGRTQRGRVGRVLNFARRRHAQRLLLDALPTAAQHPSCTGIYEARKPALEFLVDHIAHHGNLKSRRLANPCATPQPDPLEAHPCRCTNSARARNALNSFGKSRRRAPLTSHCGTQNPGANSTSYRAMV